jgi:formate dehydrogenase iron-sulfur subunit
MLAIAAVTLSTMHQSSLGSLFLLTPDSLAPAWWSPVLPVSFFLSSVAAGTAFVILMETWIAKGWRRPLPKALAAMGQIAFWSLLVYLVFRLGDMAMRGQLASAFTGRFGALFFIEIVVFGFVPLFLLGSSALRARPEILYVGALFAAFGIVLNRMNVVLFAQTFKGPPPGFRPLSYMPSVAEWGISIGLIAATIFLFGFAARHLPMLTKSEVREGH